MTDREMLEKCLGQFIFLHEAAKYPNLVNSQTKEKLSLSQLIQFECEAAATKIVAHLIETKP